MAQEQIAPVPIDFVSRPARADAVSCHADADTLREAAEAAGNSDLLDQLREDYPLGPHDQPQSMCPAFGSLRVGLRMQRTATVLSGSACCVYGLTFTSHFYGARRTVGYVPFDSETLVTGKLFEDIREAVEQLADPERYDTIVVTNLCVPTASGVPLDLLPNQINGVRIVGIDVPGFGVPTHAEAKDVLAGALLRYARQEAEAGPVAAPAAMGASCRDGTPSVAMLGELFPADPIGIAQLLEPLGLSAGPVVPVREWRELYAALDSAVVAAVHPFYQASVREFQQAGKPVLGSAPVGYEGTEAWLDAIAECCGVSASRVGRSKDQHLGVIKQTLAANPIKGRLIVSGYEGSELLVARLAVESGATVHYVGTACPRTPYAEADAQYLEAQGVQLNFRASLEEDCQALEEYRPDLAIGTTPLVQKAKSQGIPALYFTNLISARPLMGIAGAGSIGQVMNTAIQSQSRMQRMQHFFEGVGEGDNAGIWHDTPRHRPEFKAQYARVLARQNAQRKSTAEH